MIPRIKPTPPGETLCEKANGKFLRIRVFHFPLGVDIDPDLRVSLTSKAAEAASFRCDGLISSWKFKNNVLEVPLAR